MIKLIIILGIVIILLECINTLIENSEKKKNAGKTKIASITIKRNGYIISHEDVYK